MKILLQLFFTFFKIGLFTIGGGLAMLPLIQRTVAEEKKWMTEEEMIDCFAVCQALPGVIAINVATYIGKMKKGALGSIAASIGVIAPSFIIIILAVIFLTTIGDNKYISGAFTGIKAASCALILSSAFKLGKQALKGAFAWTVAILSLAMVAFLKITAVWAIIAGALAGLVYMKAKGLKGLKRAAK